MFVCTWFQGWPLGIGEWIMELIFKEDYPFSGVINYFSSSSRLGVPQDFPYAIWHVNWYYHWLSLVVEISWVWLPCHFQKTQSPKSFPGPLALPILVPSLSWCILNLGCTRGCAIDVPTEVGYPSYLFSAFWLIVAFCDGLCLLPEKNLFGENWDLCLYMGIKISA